MNTVTHIETWDLYRAFLARERSLLRAAVWLELYRRDAGHPAQSFAELQEWTTANEVHVDGINPYVVLPPEQIERYAECLHYDIEWRRSGRSHA